MAHSPDDPTAMTPEQRRRELAAILARGVLRLHPMRQTDPTPPPSGASKSAESRLEAPAPSRPHVTGG